MYILLHIIFLFCFDVFFIHFTFRIVHMKWKRKQNTNVWNVKLKSTIMKMRVKMEFTISILMQWFIECYWSCDFPFFFLSSSVYRYSSYFHFTDIVLCVLCTVKCVLYDIYNLYMWFSCYFFHYSILLFDTKTF